jgi:hypothetical protein
MNKVIGNEFTDKVVTKIKSATGSANHMELHAPFTRPPHPGIRHATQQVYTYNQSIHVSNNIDSLPETIQQSKPSTIEHRS